jgi:hypothetical protein
MQEPRLQPCRVGRVGCMQAVAGAGEGDGDGQADSKPCIVNQNETFKNWTKRYELSSQSCSYVSLHCDTCETRNARLLRTVVWVD